MEIRDKILQGNAIDVLRKFPEQSVDMCMTSPPYWGLRNYETEGVEWSDGWKGELGTEPDPDMFVNHLCDIFDEVKRVLKDSSTIYVNIGDTYGGTGSKGDYRDPKYEEGRNGQVESITQNFMPKCLIMIPSRFALEMIKRGWILRNTIIWRKPNAMPSPVADRFSVDFEYVFFFSKKKTYYFETQREPHKIESIKRACRGSISEKLDTNQYSKSNKQEHKGYDDMNGMFQRGELRSVHPQGRNKRTVWDISTTANPELHYASFPEKLCETPIKASCPLEVCKKCGTPRVKEYAKKEVIIGEKDETGKYKGSEVNSPGGRKHYISEQRKYKPNQKKIALFIKEHVGDYAENLDADFGEHTWRHWIRTDEGGASLPSPEQYEKLKSLLGLPDDYDKEMMTTVQVMVDDKGGKEEFIGYKQCDCGVEFVPGIVLDPFFGTGTTGLVAKKLGRDFVGIDISEEYIKIQHKRLKNWLHQKRLGEF